MERLRIVLCDTNRQELDRYAKICRSICKMSDVSADMKYYINSNDLLFDMGDGEFSATVSILIVDPENGFAKIPAAVRKEGYEGIILYLSHSTSPEYYRQAFDIGAFNFVQKGTAPETLAQFQSVFNLALQTAKKTARQYMMVSYAGEYRRIEVKDILYFETAADHMINVVYNGGSFQFLSTMKSLEERFSDRGFVRAHRSYLVSVNAIHRVSLGELTLNNGRRILVSRDRSASLKSAMGTWCSV